MRLSCLFLALGGALLTAAPTGATPPPLRLHDSEGRPLSVSRVPQAPVLSPSRFDRDDGAPTRLHETIAATNTRITKIVHDLTLDPATGELSGTSDITLRAETGAIWALTLYLDDGLQISTASAPGRAVTVRDELVAPLRYSYLGIAPDVRTGEELTVHVVYAGRLGCKTVGGAQFCGLGSMPFLLDGSAFPGIFDQAGAGGFNIWGAERTFILRLPPNVEAVATGELVSEARTGALVTRTWQTPGFPSYGAYLAVLGDLGTLPVRGSAPPAQIRFKAAEPSWSAEMSGWMQNILPFLDQQAGQPLSFPALDVVKLPDNPAFSGTAGYGITLLSESYGTAGERYFEETLAHENSHQWWGTLVLPADAAVTSVLIEGLATVSQIDYSASKRPPDEREAYLARRYREHAILLRYHSDPNSFPDLVLGNPSDVPREEPAHVIWAYFKGAATLEHLRTAIGDDVFARGLREYVARCARRSCTLHDFQHVLEEASSGSLETFFKQWVYDSAFPRLSVGFDQTPSETGARVSVRFSEIGGLEIPIELVLELEDGRVERRRVVVSEGAATQVFDLPARVRSVRPNPRHDAIVWSASETQGDLDFDGEVDGLDLAHCAYRVGRNSRLYGPQNEGFYGVDHDFDPRCDANGDGAIDDRELDAVAARFGTLAAGGTP